MTVQPSLIYQILQAQTQDEDLQKWFIKVAEKYSSKWSIRKDGGLRFQGRLCVPNMASLKKEILEQAHHSRFAIHLGSTKMYMDLKRYFW